MHAIQLIGRFLHREARIVKFFINMHNPIVDIEFMKKTLYKHNGMVERNCPVCNHVGYFRAFGSPPRWDAQCPSCGSLERHRLLALVLNRKRVLFKEASILHFAPETCVTSLLKGYAKHYVTADLNRDDVDMSLNIEQIELPDESFEFIFCLHVLEHVNDIKALKELYRVLKRSGMLFVAVPMIEGCPTYENETIVEGHQREVHFGQCDHVRYYGSDFRSRLIDAGFLFEEFTAFGSDAVQYGLLMGEKIFQCRKV